VSPATEGPIDGARGPTRRTTDLPLRYNAVEILERNLPARADALALLSPSRELTFGEIVREVNQFGNALVTSGVRPRDAVAFLSLDTAEWAIGFFACLKVGAVTVGMNTLLTPREVAHMLLDSGARVLLVHETLLPIARAALLEVGHVETVVVVGGDDARPPETPGKPGTMSDQLLPDGYIHYADWIAGASTELHAADTHRSDFGTLNYSSGTTGAAKGILHAHQDYALTAQLWGSDVLGLQPDDRTFSVAKLFFTFGLGGGLIFPWSVGASVVLYPGSPRKATDVLATVDRFKPTVLFNSPTGYASILAVDGFTETYDISTLRVGVSAGEALPAPVWHAINERTGLELIDGIGSTEMFHIFVSNRIGDVRPGSSGTPVPGYECRIVNPDGSAVPPGEIGNLQVKGESAALSYLHEPERSRMTFRGEWVDTGDKYYVDEDGYFWHAGRTDDMLKVGGIWVSPVEVESALIEHPAVLECAVVGMADSSDLIKPKAYVILMDGHVAGDELSAELITHCVDRMAAYKRPRWIEFVDELPKTATGKIQRYRLR
jgi:benzoate-CoA ligase family protein